MTEHHDRRLLRTNTGNVKKTSLAVVERLSSAAVGEDLGYSCGLQLRAERERERERERENKETE